MGGFFVAAIGPDLQSLYTFLNHTFSLQELSTHWALYFARLIKILNESCALGPNPNRSPIPNTEVKRSCGDDSPEG
jgi:hypothetical protein